MSREVPVRFREGLGVKFPRATRLVVMCRSAAEAEAALAVVRTWITSVGLTLHPEKTQIVDSREKSFAFLGYSFRGKLRFPRGKSVEKVRDRIRALTPRKSGNSLECIIACLNSSLRGWFAYFRHCHWSIFDEMDRMVRVRLRRLLLKRHRVNRKRQPRTQRWPNQFFADRGLYSLSDAHILLVQSTGTY